MTLRGVNGRKYYAEEDTGEVSATRLRRLDGRRTNGMQSRPMDQSTPPVESADHSSKRFSPIALMFWAVVILNVILAHFAFGGYTPSVGGDAAGNAMSKAFDRLFMIAALVLMGVLAIFFMTIRKHGFRVVLVVIAALNAFLLLAILSLPG